MIYLASPIDSKGEHGTVADLWRLEAHRSLIESGQDVYDPASVYWPRAYGGEGPTAGDIWKGNQVALQKSDGVLALLPPKVRTIGTPMEIEYARNDGKPVIVLTEDWSAQLIGSGIHVYSFRHLGTAIEDLLDQVQECSENGDR